MPRKKRPEDDQKQNAAWDQGIQTDGSEYNISEVEFILAVEEWQRLNAVRFPTLTELLGIAKSLGYRKVL